MKIYKYRAPEGKVFIGKNFWTDAEMYSGDTKFIYRTDSGFPVTEEQIKKNGLNYEIDPNTDWPRFRDRVQVSEYLQKQFEIPTHSQLYRDLYHSLGKDIPAVIERKIEHPGARNALQELEKRNKEKLPPVREIQEIRYWPDGKKRSTIYKNPDGSITEVFKSDND